MSSWLRDDCVWSEELFGEFLGGSSGVNVLCSDIDGISDFEVRCRKPMFVCLYPVAFLSLRDVIPEFAMEFVQVHSVFPGPGGSQIPFRVYGDTRMISFVSKERRYSSSGVRSIVVCKFCKR